MLTESSKIFVTPPHLFSNFICFVLFNNKLNLLIRMNLHRVKCGGKIKSMKKMLFAFGLLGVTFFCATEALAQSTEPGANLPLLPDIDTSADTTTYEISSTPYSGNSSGSVYSAATSRTATSSTQTAIDDAETGTEILFLAILSVTGGVGIFLIKKYFDFKKYVL